MKPPETLLEWARRQKPREKSVQVRVIATFKAHGGVVASLSQPRASMQTPGIADLYVFLPRRRRTVWWETKRPGGKQSKEQIEFERLCRACGHDYGLGGPAEVETYLRSIGEEVL